MTVMHVLRHLLLLSVGSNLVWFSATPLLAQTPVTPRSASGSSVLLPLNPNPDPLALPAQPAQVQINLNQPLTLQQAIEVGRRNNRDLQVLELQLQQSRATLRQSQAALYPTLSFQSSLARTDSAGAKLANAQAASNAAQVQQSFAQLLQAGGFTPAQSTLLQAFFAGAQGTQTAGTTSNTFDNTVQLSYNVFSSGQREASIRAAREQVRDAEFALDLQAEQLRLDITDAYYNIQQADALVRIAQAAVENSQISLRDTEARFRAGLGTRFDVLQAQVQLANNQQQLTQALSQQQTARRQLAQVLSVANNVNLTAADPIQVAGRWTLSLEDSIVLGFRNRVELTQQLTQRNVALQQRRIALANLGPQFNIGASFNTTDALADSQAPTWGYSVGGQLNWQIFDGGASRASAAQQEASAAIAETQFANFKNLIRFQIEQAFYALQANFENIQTNRVAVTQATEGLRLARLRFQAGVGTQLDVSNAETSLTQAQSNLLSATVNYNRSLASLQRFVSNLPLTFAAPGGS